MPGPAARRSAALAAGKTRNPTPSHYGARFARPAGASGVHVAAPAAKAVENANINASFKRTPSPAFDPGAAVGRAIGGVGDFITGVGGAVGGFLADRVAQATGARPSPISRAVDRMTSPEPDALKMMLRK